MRLKADLTLLFVTILWGTAFVAMRVAAGHGTVFYLNGLRFLLGALLLLPFVKFKTAFKPSNLIYVCIAGFALFVGVGFQQAGLVTTTAGNGGFITSLYVVIVPILLWIFWKEPPAWLTGIAVLLAVAGGFLLSTGGSFQMKPGDLLILIGSLFWALHVIIVGKVQGKIEALPFAFGQFAVCAILNLVAGVFLEHPSRIDMLAVLPAILYTGVFSIAVGFTLQVLAQKHTPTNDAALIMSLESVFAVAFGWLFLRETLLPVQILGCVLILAAVVLVQIRNGTIRAT
ncbi:MAG TPA: DMT family transporter [Anaerolineales bacterium]|nr:DMT family transporter [Anaerolineales bacterium]